MNVRRIEFRGFSVKASRDWEDITDAIDVADKPFVLGRRTTGVGAIQFSPALYRSGPVPWPSAADLLSMAEEFGRIHSLGTPYDVNCEEGALSVAGLSFYSGTDFVRAWYLSDGKNLMFATYVCNWGDEGEELAACERIIRSVRFDSGPSAQ